MNEFQQKSGAQKIRSEYHRKSRQLAELKEEVSIIKKKICTTKEQAFQLCDSGIRLSPLEKAVVWRKRLQQVTTQLQNVNLDDSEDHRYLKQLQRHVQLSMVTASSEDTELYDLVTFVADMNLMHENLCAIKEELENDINTALRALAKAHMYLTADCGLSGEGDYTDFLTHFVKQHVSPSRRKVPFQDLTNTSPPNSDYSVNHSKQSTTSVLLRDNVTSGVGTNSGRSQKDNTRESKIPCISRKNDCKDIQEMNCGKRFPINVSSFYEVPKHKGNDEEEVAGLGKTSYFLEVSKHTSKEEEEAGGLVSVGKEEVIQRFILCSETKRSSEECMVARNSQGCDNNVRAKTNLGFSIGAGFHHHGSSCGKIKLSHFSTPNKSACENYSLCQSLRSPSCDNRGCPKCDSPRGPSCANKGSKCDSLRSPSCDTPRSAQDDNQGVSPCVSLRGQLYESHGDPTCGTLRSPTWDSHWNPICETLRSPWSDVPVKFVEDHYSLDDHAMASDSHTKESDSVISDGEHVMSIPYIDE